MSKDYDLISIKSLDQLSRFTNEALSGVFRIPDIWNMRVWHPILGV